MAISETLSAGTLPRNGRDVFFALGIVFILAVPLSSVQPPGGFGRAWRIGRVQAPSGFPSGAPTPVRSVIRP